MQANLKRILRSNKPGYTVVSDLLSGFSTALSILDEDGKVLLGVDRANYQTKTAVVNGGNLAGWVAGQADQTVPMARLLERMLVQESDKRALTDELLDSYRELNILYNLSEHLLTKPQPEAIAATTLREIQQLIQFSAAWILLVDEDTDELVSVAALGQPFRLKKTIGQDDFIAGVLARNDAEICNNVPSYQVLDDPSLEIVALICAPLRTEQRVLGTVLLMSEPPNSFAARDLKLLNTIALQAGPAIEMARLYQIAVVQGRMEHELQMAYEVQASLIPAELPEISESEWEFAGRWRPARELSGDYYDFIPHGQQTYGLVIADVADKGLPSALFMVNTRSAVRTAVDQTDSPAAAISKANRIIAQEASNGLFVSMIYGQLNSQSGKFIYVNAGHNPALLFCAKDGTLLELGRTGMPIGILKNSEYEQQNVQLQPGDTLVLYTDGITEAVNSDYIEFGLDRLRAIILDNPQASAEILASLIEAAVDEFTESAPLFDDFTLMVVRRQQS